MSKRTGLFAIGIAFLLGMTVMWLFRGQPTASHEDHSSGNAEHADAQEWYTCSMHPQIRMPEQGQCPICFMDLIPINDEAQSADPRLLTLSNAAVQLAEIRTAPVTRDFRTKTVHLQGRIEYDETRIRQISAWLPGRIERVYLDYTGVSVREGEHLVDIYSPKLINAQEDFLQALKSYDLLDANALPIIRETAAQTIGDAREKLFLLGLKRGQIGALEANWEINYRITIYSPSTGIAIQKHVNEGAYVETGTPLYTIAELEHVWLVAEAYESDLAWLHFGQQAEFEVRSFPGTFFNGRISFISPSVDPATRTIKVRINVENPEQRLKPGMFANATIHSKVTEHGRAIDPELAGKYVCPMHPEIVKDEALTCDICGMALVTSESLGFSREPASEEMPLLIPRSAPLITGRRALVYVKLPDRPAPTFEMREVVLGPRVRDQYIVKEGLSEGELVVYQGNFKIDAERQIQMKPSMMSLAPAETGPPNGRESVPEPYRETLSSIREKYEAMRVALAADRSALDQARQLGALLPDWRVPHLAGDQLGFFEELRRGLKIAADTYQKAADIEQEREAFHTLSHHLIELMTHFSGGLSAYRFHCPMGPVEGGSEWLQPNPEMANPYMGTRMLRCGTQMGLVGSAP